MRSRGVGEDVIAALPHFGLSSICNIVAAIKTAKTLGLGAQDAHPHRRDGRRGDVHVGETEGRRQAFRRPLRRRARGRGVRAPRHEASPEHVLLMGPVERDRIFNLGYFTWVEQRGVALADFEARRDQAFWRGLHVAAAGLGRNDRRLQPAQRRGVTASRLVCAGCGWEAPAGAADPFRCARAGSDDVDHVLAHRLGAGATLDRGDDENPFVRYRECLYAWHAARARGMSDGAFVDLVRRIDERIAASTAAGFARRRSPGRRRSANASASRSG